MTLFSDQRKVYYAIKEKVTRPDLKEGLYKILGRVSRNLRCKKF
jgi:hypothetical protein